MKKTLWIVFVSTLILAIVYFYFSRLNQHKPIELVIEKAHYGPISNSVTATGTMQPVDTVAIGSQVSGTIKKIYVDFNSVVHKGQLIAELDKSLLNAQAEQNGANLSSMESELVYQKQNVGRQTQLFDVGAISKADFETAQYQYYAAVSAVASAKAQMSAANKNLSYANIYSPIEGIVLSRNISEGQTVAASFNTPILFSVAKDLKKMQVSAAVDEADIGNVKAGQHVSFTVDAFPNEVFTGTVNEVRLRPVVSANVVTYVTIIDAPNDNGKLKPGMTANITIFSRQVNDALLIPARAINFVPTPLLSAQYSIVDQSSHSLENVDSSDSKNGASMERKDTVVWILKGRQLIKKQIVTGLNDDINIQVLAGLEKNDAVIEGVQQDVNNRNKVSVNSNPFMPVRRPSGQGNNGNKLPTSNSQH